MAPEGSLAQNIGPFAQQIVAIMDKWHIKNHPFFKLVEKGELPIPALGVWLAQHYHYVLNGFTGFGLLYSRGPEDVRRLIIENIAEEAGIMAGGDREPHDHMEMIFDFCREAGLSKDEVLNFKPTPVWVAQGRNYLYVMEYEPVGVALAMAATQEGQQVDLNVEINIPSLQSQYGYAADGKEIAFFVEHAEADEDHSIRQLQLAEKYCDTPELKQQALDAALRACQIRWETVSDVYHREVLKDHGPMPAGV